MPAAIPPIVAFSQLGVRFGWTSWGDANAEGEKREFDVCRVEPVHWPHQRWPSWGHRKPEGGLWLSPLVSTAPLTSCWAQWCEDHDLPHGPTVEVSLADAARIVILRTGEDVELLAAQYPADTDPKDAGGFTEPAVDWVALGAEVDAVYMTARAEDETKGLLKPYPRTASGWWETASMLVYRSELVLRR